MAMIRTYLLLFFFTCSQLLSAQNYEGQQWMSLALKYKINKDWKLELEQGWRIAELAWTSTMYSDLSLSYKLNKYFKFALAYRFAQRDGSWFTYHHLDHRFAADVVADKKFGDFKFNYRIRIQNRYRDLMTSIDGAVPEWTVRNKLSVDYDLNDFKPYASCELWTGLSKNQAFTGTNQYRAYLGIEYKVNKKIDLGVFIMRQREFNTKNPDINGVFGINASFELN